MGKLIKVVIVGAGLAAGLAVAEWFRRTRRAEDTATEADEKPTKVVPKAGEVWKMALPDVPDASKYLPTVVVEGMLVGNLTVTQVSVAGPGTYRRASSTSTIIGIDTFLRHYRKVDGPINVLKG